MPRSDPAPHDGAALLHAGASHPVVEVVRSVHTDAKQAERVGAIMSSLGKR